jgi:hypothetical protein
MKNIKKNLNDDIGSKEMKKILFKETFDGKLALKVRLLFAFFLKRNSLYFFKKRREYSRKRKMIFVSFA